MAIRDRGSHWGEISWTSFDSDVNADSFIVQYQRTSNDTAVVLSTNRVYSSSDGSTYSAIVTDLSPATQYNIQLTVHSGANTNKSEEIRFTTNDTSNFFSHLAMTIVMYLYNYSPNGCPIKLKPFLFPRW